MATPDVKNFFLSEAEATGIDLCCSDEGDCRERATEMVRESRNVQRKNRSPSAGSSEIFFSVKYPGNPQKKFSPLFFLSFPQP
ncbi:hypothetical protein VNO77_08855 [Canavalia gladiata]|uniref:Uncharacterized protein n=1 Tax=Canavalia gladiata TaxID=3824 RepID=A0AAN9M8S6_CANGL